MARKPTPQQMRFVKAYLTTAHEQGAEAARQAGYKTASEVGSRLARRLAAVIEEERAKLNTVKRMSNEDIERGLEEIAQDREHRDRYNALKTLASIRKIDTSTGVDKTDIAASVTEAIRVFYLNSAEDAPRLARLPESKLTLPRAKPA